MSTSRNVISLYGSSFATAVVGLAAAPIYLHWLGIEAYALTGVLVTLQMWFVLLDLGLGPALSRAMTQFAAGTREAVWLGSVLASLERVFAVLAIIAVATMAAAAPWLAGVWLEASALSEVVVTQSLMLIGTICGLRLWQGLYVGGLTGMQQLAWLSGFNTVAACARLGLSVAAIAWLWTDVRMLLSANLVLGAVELALVRRRLRSALPTACLNRAPDWRTLTELRGYAGGLALTSLVTILLTGLDKVVLPAFVALEPFGWYMIAYTASQAIYRLITPVHTAVLPRLTELQERGDERAFAALYHRAAQATAVMVMPIGLLLAACPAAALHAWTGDVVVAAESAGVLRILAIATVAHGCMYVPYAAQLAHGWTSLALWINIVMVLLLVPALLIGVQHYGILAAAWSWLTLNVVYLLVGQALMTRRILRGHMLRWYFVDLAPPAGVAAAGAAITAWAMPADPGRLAAAAILALAAGGITALAAFASPMRRELLARLKRRGG